MIIKYVKIYDSKGQCQGVADIEQNYDKAGYAKLFDSNMHVIGFVDVDNIPESGENMPFVQVFDENIQPCGVVTADNIRHSDGYLITLQKNPSGAGAVTGGGRFIAGTSVTVVATPDAQSEYPEFDGWYEGETKVSENASYTFTVSGTRTLVAKFKEATPTVVAVDLGLPSGKLWANMNVGATAPEAKGLFFSWGNVDGVDGSDAAAVAAMTEAAYANTNGSALQTDIAPTAANDAAVANLGAPWRMPTKEEFMELYNNCDWTWKQVNGVNGYEVKSKASGNNNSIFLPTTGYIDGALKMEYYCNCWSTSIKDTNIAFCLVFVSGDIIPQNYFQRHYGCTVRAIQDAPNI